MNARLKIALAVATLALAAQASAQVTFYERDGFQGRSFTTERPIDNLGRQGFNDQISSVEVLGERWEVCEDRSFSGRCVVLRPGRYPSLAAMSLNNRIASVRAVPRNARIDERRYAPAPVVAKVTFYEQPDFTGRSFTTDQSVINFERYGFNDRASSVEVVGQPWEVCEDRRFGGHCIVLRPGRYSTLAAMGLNDRVSSVRAISPDERIDERRYAPLPVMAQVTFYEQENFRGRSFTTDQPVLNFQRYGFNDRASSVEVLGEPWEVCEAPRFNGRCVVLRPGRYPTLEAMGLNDRVSSVRDMSGNAPTPASDYRRRNDEQLYQAQVTSVRAVVGTPEQRCWVEREQVTQEQRSPNVPGAIAGAIIGGILGHQVGGGSGKDIATVGGAVAGAAVGAQVGRSGSAQPASTQDVQRCENVPSQAQPEFWDVSYNFRGQAYRVQLTAPPGPTVTVNAQGEPRN